jgi:hypothetical protein
MRVEVRQWERRRFGIDALTSMMSPDKSFSNYQFWDLCLAETLLLDRLDGVNRRKRGGEKLQIYSSRAAPMN